MEDLKFTDPAAFYNKVHGNYAELTKDKKYQFTYQPILYSNLGDVQNKTILDLACGSGQDLSYISQLSPKELWGIDISESLISDAKQLLGNKATLLVDDMARSDLYKSIGSEKYDLIISSFTLYYMDTNDKLDAVFNNVYQMLKIGGKSMFLLQNDDNNVKTGIDKIYLTPTKVISGDFTGITVLMKLLASGIEAQNYFRPFSMYEESLKKIGFSKIERIETLIDEEGLKVYSKEDWDIIVKAKPLQVIVAHK